MSLNISCNSPVMPGASFARFFIASAVAGLCLATSAQSTDARNFLEGQSNGMKKCVRAILGGYEARRVNVHGHHFNCKPLLRKTSSNGGQYRQIWLSHSQRGIDDQVYFFFYVDSLNMVRPNSVRMRIDEGVSIRSFISEFEGPANPPAVADYAYYAERARNVCPVKVGKWKHAAHQIKTIVIAELGNPDNRGTAPRQVNCDIPTFWEHDNFRGRSYKLAGSQPNFHRVIVSGKSMGNAISSMCIPRGWQVIAYALPDYKGISYRFSGPRVYEDLKRQQASNGQQLNWGDLISSVRVSKR